MVNLFGRRKSAADATATSSTDHLPSLPTKGGPKRAATFATKRKGAPSPDELGVLPRPHHGSAPPASAVYGAPLRRSHSDGSRPTSRGLDGEELQLAYGYFIVGTETELDLLAVEEIVRLCAQQIKARGLDRPLLFSSRALDLSTDGTSNLIRSYFANRRAWPAELQFADPHDLAALVKWALGRVTTPQGGHGFLPWEMYERWRAGEKEKGYPARYLSTHLLHHLPTSTAALLSTLLNLMSSAVAYTVKNGTTPRRLSAIFSSYVFGLPDDLTFEETYNAFLRYSHALEHLLLSHIRDQYDVEGHLPTNLLNFIADYRNDLQVNLNRPSPSANLATVARIRRAARFNSKDLIRSAGGWDVPRSRSWASIFPIRALTQPDGSPAVAFSNQYKKLLNLRASGASQIDDEDEDPSMQRYKNSADKEWMEFKTGGFAAGDTTKLKFDLRESERNSRRKKHETMDWSTFADSGFGGRESYVNTDLLFDPTVNDLVTSWPDERRDLTTRLRKTEKELPPFPFDITPTELNPVSIDEAFFETWCDVLVSSGWQRDEIKESNWVLIQYRCRPKDNSSPTSPSSDGRTSERWFLIEEIVPKEYLQSLQDGKAKAAKSSRRISFLRSVRRKPKSSTGSGKTQGISYNSLSASAPAPGSGRSPRASPNLDESVFQPGPGGETKQLKLANGHGVRLTPGVTPALSRATTLNRQSTDGEKYRPANLVIPEEPVPAVPAGYLAAPAGEAPLPSPRSGKFMGHGIGGTLSSQRGELPSAKPMPPSPTTSTPSVTSDRVKPPSPTTALLNTFRRYSNAGNRDKRRDARLGQVSEFDYETHSINDMAEETDVLPEDRDGKWIDVIRSPRTSAPAPEPRPAVPVESEREILYPADSSDLPPHQRPHVPAVRVRQATGSDAEHAVPVTSASTQGGQERISEDTQRTDESPYDGVVEEDDDADAHTGDQSVWRGSQASAPLPPPVGQGYVAPSSRSNSAASQGSRPPAPPKDEIVERNESPVPEDPMAKIARLRAKYGSGADSTRASNVSRLISMYAKRDDAPPVNA